MTTPSQLVQLISDRFSTNVPLLLWGTDDAIKLELKPYLQPFERVLAMREVNALLSPGDEVLEEYGFLIVHTKRPEADFIDRLTYWQRAGRSVMRPTVQKSLELTQNGLDDVETRREFHNARRLRYGPHDIHEYRGKFFPQLVRSLITIAGTSDGAVVLDPMCGSGTTPCEALAFGRTALCADLNPLSVLISSVKAGVVLESPTRFYKTLARHLDSLRFKPIPLDKVWSEHDLDYLMRWFAPAALQDLAGIVSEIRGIRSRFYREFMFVGLSNCIRGVSWQKDTDLRVRKEVRPYTPGLAIERFRKEIEEQRSRIYPYLCLLPPRKRKPTLVVAQGNSVDVATLFGGYRGRVDLLVTSPPYATALPYLDTDRLSLIVLGLLPHKEHRNVEAYMVGTREVTESERTASWKEYCRRKKELPRNIQTLIDSIADANHGDGVGFRRRNLPALLGRYFLSMRDAMRSALVLMKPGARAFYVVGNNSTEVQGTKVDIPTDMLLFEIAATVGWKQEELINMELLPSRDIFRENRGSKETILCLRA